MSNTNMIANIILNGKTTSAFNNLANKLTAMGQVVDQIGSKVREFENDSIEVYRSYEDNMLAAEFALSAQYKSATKLQQVMNGLDDAAQQWAATTIFHTHDVSEAINEAAHAGWSYEQILTGIPQAMLIAQAGGLELSEGLDYLVKMMNSTGTEFDYAGMLIDQWSMAANRSATNIDELGQAFLSMGASATFGSTTHELFTMLAVLANAGTTGTKAGTLLRTAMMRLVAPTQKAKTAMESLGATEEELAEWDEIFSEGEGAEKAMKEIGVSAYDTTTGQLRPMIDIFKDLHDALSGMQENERNDILSRIFPLRSINAAMAFYNAIEDGSMEDIFNSIGDSEEYAASGAKIMMSGLTGAVEELLSKWEEFELRVGEALTPDIERVSGYLGNILDAINGLDEPTLQGLVGALNTLATLGPAMMTFGLAMKIIGTLGPTGTVLLALAVGANAAARYFKALDEIQFGENFGTMRLNLQELGNDIDSLETKFTVQKESIAEWEAALELAESAYADSATSLSERMLMGVISGKTLGETEKKNLTKYAEDIVRAVNDGIANAEASDLTFLEAMFGDETTPEGINAYATAVAVVDSYYKDVQGKANAIGEELREQMVAALTDDTLDDNEQKAITSTIERYNKIMAEIQSMINQEAYYTQLYRAQNVSWETAQDFIQENSANMDKELRSMWDLYAGKKAHYRAMFESAAARGEKYTTIDGQVYDVNTAWENIEAMIDQEQADAEAEIRRKYGDASQKMARALFKGAGIEDEYDAFLEIMALGIGQEGWNKGYSTEDYQNIIDKIDTLYNSDDYKLLLKTVGNLRRMGLVLSNGAENALTSENVLWGWGEEAKQLMALGEVREEQIDVPVNVDSSTVDEQIGAIQVTTPIRVPASLFVASTAFLNGEYNQGGDAGSRNLYLYADGGRATTASIFGDAGAEWAIPEEHSQRTADLLNAARQASGFTWGDLISRYGGLNADANHQVITVNYSPVINGVSSDVAGALRQDKENLMRILKDALKENSLRAEVGAWA